MEDVQWLCTVFQVLDTGYFTTVLGGRYCYPCFSDKETGAERS